MAKIKGDLARCQRDLRDAKTGADAEIVARIELESIVQTKDDEINFLKNMYEEKIRQVRGHLWVATGVLEVIDRFCFDE